MDSDAGGQSVNPLLSDSAREFDDLIAAVGPASLLVAIEWRMGPLLRARTSAEDILQDVFLLAWRDRRRFEWRGLRSFRAWLLTIVDNRIRDAKSFEEAEKRGGGAPWVRIAVAEGSSADAFTCAVESTTPSRIAVYAERAAAIREALGSLPEDLRDVVRLRLTEQLPFDEIASLLGIGVSAVAHRFRKGVELYARRLEAALTSRGFTGRPYGDSAADPASPS